MQHFQVFSLPIIGLELSGKMKGNIDTAHAAWFCLHYFSDIYRGSGKVSIHVSCLNTHDGKHAVSE